MATISSRRLGFVILVAVLLTILFTWRLQAGGLMAAMFDSSSSPVSPIVTPIPTPTPVPTPTAPSAPPPIVICVTPDHGSAAKPNRVTIRGAYFQAGATVTIAAWPLENVQRTNHTEIVADVPAGLAPGVYAIRVCNPDAQCGRLADAFTVTDAAPVLTAIVPSEGRNDAANEVAVFGYNLQPGVAITIGEAALADLAWISEVEARGIVPPGLPPGTYDVTARNPDVADAGVLPGGYTVLAGAADDFSVAEADIWTDPATLRQGATTAILLGANIHRQGGDIVKTAEVRFFLGDPAAGGVLLGATTTPPMPPAVGAVEPVFIPWSPGNLVGAASIYVQVDPAGLIPEVNEANNTARRDLIILPPAPDITPPTIVSFDVNGGDQSTTNAAVQLALKATDDRSGVHTMYLVERIFNATANMWLVVQQTGWIPFQATPAFTLTGPAGARYIEAWIADAAGNVAPQPARARINYLPASDAILQGQVRLFRFTVATGERWRVVLTTLNAAGDADLYVWGPYHEDHRDLWSSNQAGTIEDIVEFVASEAGEYDIEVHGWNPYSEYRLTVTSGGAALSGRETAAAVEAAKPTPTRPADAAAAPPPWRHALPAAPIAPSGKVLLPLIAQAAQPPAPRPTYRLHLPLILRAYGAAQPVGHKIYLPMAAR